jgi:hypothetical protein
MRPKMILLIPSAHEQSPASFHVEGRLAHAFLEFLSEKGLSARQPPDVMGMRGPDRLPIVEIAITSVTSDDLLEGLVQEFLTRTVS